MRKHNKNGFTLIELMITVVIVAVLAAIALPGYNNYVRKARRADGQAALLALQLAQEKFRVSCPFYAQSLGNADSCGANAGASTVKFSATSPDGYYTVAIVGGSASATAFTAQATATSKGGQNQDSACPASNFQATQGGPDKGTAAKALCWGEK